MSGAGDVQRLDAARLRAALEELLGRYGLAIEWHSAGTAIPGSYWGESEAGLTGHRVHLRFDTPLHSALHEACHAICMDAERRAALHTDAGGDFAEENGVCYLQVLLADELPDCGREAMLADMDRWGYTFRLGSASAWFEQDAGDAREWLLAERLIDATGRPLTRLRGGIPSTNVDVPRVRAGCRDEW